MKKREVKILYRKVNAIIIRLNLIRVNRKASFVRPFPDFLYSFLSVCDQLEQGD